MRSFTLGSTVIDPPFALGPLAELTDPPFRRLVTRLGGCGLFYTPMLTGAAARALEASHIALDTGLPSSPPLVAQLAPIDADEVRDALPRVLANCTPLAIDINMGCSAPRVRKRGAGTALLFDPARVRSIFDAVRERWPGPITAKIRLLGNGSVGDLVAFVSSLASLGVSCVCVHGRTAKEGFTRTARWEPIRELAAVSSIPVVGCGDIRTAAKAVSALEESGCAAVMIARAALRDPWIFSRIDHQRRGIPFPEPTRAEFADAVVSLIDDISASYSTPERAAARTGLITGYLLDRFPFGRRAAIGIARLRDPREQRSIISRFLERSNETGLTSDRA